MRQILVAIEEYNNFNSSATKNISPKYIVSNYIRHNLKEEPLDCLDLTLGKDTLQIFHTSTRAKHLCSTLFAKNHDSYTQVILMPCL